MPLERVDIINRALVRIGEDEVAFADVAAEDASPLVWTYETIIEDVLGKYPWRCTLRTFQLSQGTIPLLSPWDYAYPLLSNRLGLPRRVWKSTTLEDYNILKLYEIGLDFSGNIAILTDETVVVAQDQKRPALAALDPALMELLIQALTVPYWIQVAADEAKSLRAHEKCWGSVDGRVPGQYFMAKQAESVPQPSKVAQLEDGPLISARR